MTQQEIAEKYPEIKIVSGVLYSNHYRTESRVFIDLKEISCIGSDITDNSYSVVYLKQGAVFGILLDANILAEIWEAYK